MKHKTHTHPHTLSSCAHTHTHTHTHTHIYTLSLSLLLCSDKHSLVLDDEVLLLLQGVDEGDEKERVSDQVGQRFAALVLLLLH